MEFGRALTASDDERCELLGVVPEYEDGSSARHGSARPLLRSYCSFFYRTRDERSYLAILLSTRKNANTRTWLVRAILPGTRNFAWYAQFCPQNFVVYIIRPPGTQVRKLPGTIKKTITVDAYIKLLVRTHAQNCFS